MPRHLKHDGYMRRAGGETLTRMRAGGGASIVAFALLAIALLGLSRLDHPLVRATRITLADAAAPVLRLAMIPFDPIRRGLQRVANLWNLEPELDRLRAEAERLKGWEGRAREFERRIGELEKLTKAVPEKPMTFATARVIADSTNPFVRTAMIDAGRDQGMKPGFPAINADGVVGRLLATGPRASRLLLLNDFNSRVPVMVGPYAVRAIIIGDNGPHPRLQNPAPGETIKPGDDVVTSGVGGIYPRGLRVGTVVDMGDELRVELSARLDRLEYVSILFFETPGIESADDTTNRTRSRRAAIPPGERAATFKAEGEPQP